MQKNNSLRIALISVIGVTAVFIATGWMAYAIGWIGFKGSAAQSADERLKAEKTKHSDEDITLICEANYTMPGDDLDAPPKVYKEMMAAGLDYKNKAGWYQGVFSISESRKGAMVVKGSRATVSRPAMFERFGTMVTGEQFTLDRSTGAFLQSLTIKDGRKIEIVKGYCGKMTKAPF
ncbi:MAG: hypothetical protein WCJ76_01115 [Comamonadaceae bacterium]